MPAFINGFTFLKDLRIERILCRSISFFSQIRCLLKIFSTEPIFIYISTNLRGFDIAKEIIPLNDLIQN